MNKLCFIDVETCGLIPRKHSLIQIAALIENGEATVDFNMKVRPFDGALVDDIALKVNGISRVDLNSFPEYLYCAGQFCSFMETVVDKYNPSDKMYFLAYNAPFDEGFVRHFVGKYFGSYFWWPCIDVAALAAMMLHKERAKMKDFKLGTVYKTIFNREIENAHDALADIKATREIFNAWKEWKNE